MYQGVILLFLLPDQHLAYYVGPEVGKAPGETRSVKTRGFGFGSPNATSLAEAAYVPYVYSVGNNVVTFLRSIIPALQPKVDFFAEQIQDTIDTANGKLMQKLENSNNGIIAAENFFTGLMRAVVLGKGPEDEERRRRLAVALIKSGMLNNTRISTVTTTSSPPATSSTTTKRQTMTTTTTTTTRAGVTLKPKVSSSTTTTVGTTTQASSGNVATNPTSTLQKARDNDFNKSKVINIVRNML